ncbi:MAG: cupin domain-containing protein [Chloroflexota bacterium]
MPSIEKVNVARKFDSFHEQWSPKIVGELNDIHIKLVKLQGEFVWHHHDVEDEMFLVVKGRLLLKLRDADIWVEEGEFVVVPHGVEHMTAGEEEVHVMMIEPKSTVNTGSAGGERTVTDPTHL